MAGPLHIVCAASLARGRELFETIGSVTVLPEKDIGPDVVRDADLLATRTKVRVNDALLQGSKIKFYGTATAGTDHMDIACLDRRGIAWSAAPGCNANSVAEWVVAALLHLSRTSGLPLAGKTIAIIGAGHVGTRVAEKALALGLKPVLNDPPLAVATGDPKYRPLDEVLPQADIVTLHVPLMTTGPHATFKMADEKFFGRMKPGAIFLNASRGEVVDEEAFQFAASHGVFERCALDVFDGEPDISRAMLDAAHIATPHIAGYSYEGRLNGTVMIYRAACQFFELAPRDMEVLAGDPRVDLNVDARGMTDVELVESVVKRAYDILRDDAALRSTCANMGKHFTALRNGYPDRREFPAHRVRLANASPAAADCLRRLGFEIA